MPTMTKEEFKENNPQVVDVNAAWRKDELLPGTISGVVPEFPRDKQLDALMKAERKPALDSAPKPEGLKVFGMFGGNKSKSPAAAPSNTPTPKKPR